MSAALAGGIPPHNLDAERAVLGCLLLDPERLTLLDGVRPEIFYTETHRIIARAMITLARASQPVDLLTLAARLRAEGELEAVGSEPVLAMLVEQAAIAVNVERYLDLVRECATRRELATFGMELVRQASDDSGPTPAAIIAAGHSRLLQLDAGVGDVVEVRHILEDEAPEDQPLPTGIMVFDDLCDGLTPGHLTVLAGRPGMGKTALSFQIAHRLARVEQIPTLFLSLEMPPREIGARLLSFESGVNSRHILRQTYPHPEPVDQARAALSKAPLFLQRTFARQLPDVLGVIRTAVIKHHVKAVIVDHLGRIQPPRRASRYEEMALVAEELKASAMHLRVPVLALCQLNRNVEARNSTRPMLSDLRDSGRIEEEADEILFVWTQEERPEGKDPLPVSLYLAKDRRSDRRAAVLVREVTGPIPRSFQAIGASMTALRMLWPAAIEDLVTEGCALDQSCERGEPVDRQRAAEIVRAIEEYVDALPEGEQSRVSKALARRFVGEAI